MLRIPRDQDDGYSDLQMFVQDRWTLEPCDVHRRPALRLLRRLRQRLDAAAEPLERGAVLPGLRGRSTGRTSRRAAASPTTCSAPARRRIKMSIARYVAPREQRHRAGQQPADHDRPHRHPHMARSQRRLHDLQPRRLGAERRARADEQRQLRQGHPDHGDARSADAQRLERARRDRRMAGCRAARADAAGRPARPATTCATTGNQTRRRQHAGDQRRLHRAVLHQRPVACRSAWWRRLSGLRSVRHHGRRRAAGAEQHDLRQQLRRRHRPVPGRRHHAPTARLAGGTFLNGGFNMQQRLLDTCASDSRSTRPRGTVLPVS